jgi:electron transfer flavoprotein beta subunit
MKIAVVVRQVPDLIEPLEIDSCGAALDLGSASFIVNESDDHALEQAILMKEATGATVNVVALDFGEVDNTLYTAAAKGADRVFKVPLDGPPPPPRAAAVILAEALKPLDADLVLVGVQAHDELDGGLSPFLAAALNLPYVGVIRGVKAGPEPGSVTVCKEFPGAVMARLKVKLPAVLGILGADQPPRYVPVSRIRAAMKSTQFAEVPVATSPGLDTGTPALFTICRLYPPISGSHAQMLTGSEAEIAARIAEILAEKGMLK